MINLVICDDESYMVERIDHEIKKILSTDIEYYCYCYTDTDELLKLSNSLRVDILLLDIEMPKLNGFKVVELVRKSNENVIVIFITNMDLYVYESLKYHPFRFIRKTHLEELKEALLSALALNKSQTQKITMRINSNKIVKVNQADIVYFESIHNNLKVVTIDSTYTYRGTLKSIENDYRFKCFLRIHSGYLVNMKYIYVIDNTELEVRYLDKKVLLPISRGRHSDVSAKFIESMR